jgi:hypothetical protein
VTDRTVNLAVTVGVRIVMDLATVDRVQAVGRAQVDAVDLDRVDHVAIRVGAVRVDRVPGAVPGEC